MAVAIRISERCRNRLGVIICVLCSLLALCGLALIDLGLFIQVHINNQLILLESFDKGFLPNFLCAVGSLLLLINVITAKLGYDCGFSCKREKFRMALVPLLVIILLFIWVILATAIVCMVSRERVEGALHDGLGDAMNRYKTNLRLKVALDKLQMRERCCGSRAYTDWFNVGWINPQFINTKDPYVKDNTIDGNVFIDSVPFSCCDVTVQRPCVANFVMNKKRHLAYDRPTLYVAGCTEHLMDRLENHLLQPTGYFVFGLFGSQVLVFILLRYLQTSITSAIEEGDPDGIGTGFLFPNCCKACATGNPEKYAKAWMKNNQRNSRTLDRSKRSAPMDTTDDTYDVIDESLMDGGGMGGADDIGDHGGNGGKHAPGHRVSNKVKGGGLASKFKPKKPKFLEKRKPKKPKMPKTGKKKSVKSPKKMKSSKSSKKKKKKK